METLQKTYDLESRTFEFARKVRSFIKDVPKTISNKEDLKQLARSSGSIGANYIEANDSLGEKDKLMKMRISKKEAKESKYWLLLIDTGNDIVLEKKKDVLVQESHELMLIFGSILQKLINLTNK